MGAAVVDESEHNTGRAIAIEVLLLTAFVLGIVGDQWLRAERAGGAEAEQPGMVLELSLIGMAHCSCRTICGAGSIRRQGS